jgi:C4-dicarboxylate-specific signal transduction histidine kinase
MSEDSARLAIEGVRFFGEMSASVSHEIKNVLAVINENAGLLADMLAMNANGLPLDVERLHRMAQSIAGQVNRGDGLVKDMNRFAHSADDARETVDVVEVIRFITALAGRLIAMHGPPPQLAAPAAVNARTNRFFLENLVWACLRRAMQATAAGQPVAITAENHDDRACIRYHGLSPDALGAPPAFPSSRETSVLALLGAEVTVDTAAGEIRIMLP